MYTCEREQGSSLWGILVHLSEKALNGHSHSWSETGGRERLWENWGWDWVGQRDCGVKDSGSRCDWTEGSRERRGGWASHELGGIWDLMGTLFCEWPLYSSYGHGLWSQPALFKSLLPQLPAE